MTILENLNPPDPQREIELLREVIKAKDALIAELNKRPVAQPVYVPYPTYPTWPNAPVWTVTTATSQGVATSGTAVWSGSIGPKK